MNLNEERKKKIWIAILSVLLVIIIIYRVFFMDNSEKPEVIDTETISIVDNVNDFYVVSSCVSKYLNYLASNDTEKLLILLSSRYKKDNSIDSSNIYNFIGRLDGNHSFNPRKMYVKRLSKSVYKFYVYGLISKEQINGNSEEKDYYIVVILDRSSMTFAIEKYDSSIF